MAGTIIEYWREINPVTSTLRIRYPLQWPECLYSVPGRKDWPRCRPRHRPTSYPAFLKKGEKIRIRSKSSILSVPAQMICSGEKSSAQTQFENATWNAVQIVPSARARARRSLTLKPGPFFAHDWVAVLRPPALFAPGVWVGVQNR